MNVPTLCLHSGAQLVNRATLDKITTPAGLTDTHFTIPHRTMVEMTVDRLTYIGMRVLNEQHALSHENNRYFGIFSLANSETFGGDGASLPDDYGLVLGLRNSHDQTFPAGLALGSHVFICDNLAFGSEVKINRKHTRYAIRDLPVLIVSAVNKIAEQRSTMKKRVENYKDTALVPMRAHDLIVQAIDNKVIGPQKIEKVLREWRRPKHEEFKARTAWSLFNAFTEVMKEYSLEASYKRTQGLHGMFDAMCGIN